MCINFIFHSKRNNLLLNAVIYTLFVSALDHASYAIDWDDLGSSAENSLLNEEDFLMKILFLPTILYRIESLLIAEDIRRWIAAYGIGKIELQKNEYWPHVNFGIANKQLKNQLKMFNVKYEVSNLPSNDIVLENNKIVDFSRIINEDLGPCPYSILNAITLESAQDEISLEKTEFLGDSYLQYVISMVIYFENPDLEKHILNDLRTEVVKNLNLVEKAEVKNIGGFLICKNFEEKDWLPPSYQERNITTMTGKHIIKDKSIADCVESLIGVYLVCSGQKGALTFMKLIELYPATTNTFNVFEDFSPASETQVEIPNEFRERINQVQEDINYQFKKKGLLLQALVHPTFTMTNRDSYINLVYVGEAVYQYLITRTLFMSKSFSSAGALTRARERYLKRTLLGCIAVRLNLNNNLLRKKTESLESLLETSAENEEINYFKVRFILIHEV